MTVTNVLAFDVNTFAVIAAGPKGRVVDTFYVYVGGKGPYMAAGVCADTPSNRAKIARFAAEHAAWKKAEPNFHAFRNTLEK